MHTRALITSVPVETFRQNAAPEEKTGPELKALFLLVLVTLDARRHHLTETRTSSKLSKRAEKSNIRIHVLDPLNKTPLLCFALTERGKKSTQLCVNCVCLC